MIPALGAGPDPETDAYQSFGAHGLSPPGGPAATGPVREEAP
ncbi:hypothetical protein SLI_6727 [Streptomyces lividans 1326]|uniref:Uncharacterized protein n=1 Tax=Streptomyces lividans 1326 TaxID=1200984 RepID=A0A7U9HE23_STRLI|nr:hypothetical protein SLI_6727 [Streptomyces lividans 1326]